LISDLDNREIFLDNKKILQSYLSQKLLSPVADKEKKLFRRENKTIFQELILNDSYLNDMKRKF
jgi:hypothetical protein